MELCQGGELFDHIVEAQHFTERKVRVLPEVGEQCVCVCAGTLLGALLSPGIAAEHQC
jgi:hypothetical protein